jgi:hypothetical protein
MGNTAAAANTRRVCFPRNPTAAAYPSLADPAEAAAFADGHQGNKLVA